MVTIAQRTKPRFYWVTDVPMPNALWAKMTNRGMGVSSLAGLGLFEVLERLPLGCRCVHDVRLLFEAKGLYELLKCSDVVKKVVPVSEDLQLKEVLLGFDRFARVTVHKNDSVSIVIGASSNPYPITDEGVADFWLAWEKFNIFLRNVVLVRSPLSPCGFLAAGTLVETASRLKLLVMCST